MERGANDPSSQRAYLQFLDRLQARARGYLLRRELLNSVRNQYETIAEEIHSTCTDLPWSETVSWPHPHRLCYPYFLTEHDGAICMGSTVGASTQWPHEEQPLKSMPLPNDRESLLEFRRQLYMELVWLKQAISSRQQYLKFRADLPRQLAVNST